MSRTTSTKMRVKAAMTTWDNMWAVLMGDRIWTRKRRARLSDDVFKLVNRLEDYAMSNSKSESMESLYRDSMDAMMRLKRFRIRTPHVRDIGHFGQIMWPLYYFFLEVPIILETNYYDSRGKGELYGSQIDKECPPTGPIRKELSKDDERSYAERLRRSLINHGLIDGPVMQGNLKKARETMAAYGIGAPDSAGNGYTIVKT